MPETKDINITELFESVPLGMSKFQLQALVLNKATPARARRQCVMELHKRYQALKEAEFRRKRMTIQRKKLLKKMEEDKDADERELAAIDLEEHDHKISMEDVLIKDAMTDVGNIMQVLDLLPKMTRDEFEQLEPEYWKAEFILQARRDVIANGSINAGLIEEMEKLGMNGEQVLIEVTQNVHGELKAVEERMKQLAAGDKPKE